MLRILKLCLFLFVLFPATGFAVDAASLLEPEQAFKFSARLLDSNTIEVKYFIAEGYYLYREKFRFEVSPAAIKLGKPAYPLGKIKHDEFFGSVETYRGELRFTIPFTSDKVTPVSLKSVSQGCADVGVCYPPLTQTANLVGVKLIPPTGNRGFPGTAQLAGNFDESAQVAGLFSGRSFAVIVASFFGFGLLLAFTPCVFPMIPILSGIIVGQGAQLTKLKAFLLSLAYVLGMAVTYAIAGVAAGLSGTLLSAALQNPWVLGGFAIVFVLLALSMFGFYELQLPASLQSRFSATSNRLSGGNVFGVFCMGALSVIIVGPCVAAPLAGALLYIGRSHDVWLGGSALFAMALGMGTPLLLIGFSAGTLLPRVGAWMEGVKKFFGALLLGVAIWLISPLIPVAAQMLLWAVLLIVAAMYLKALDSLPPQAAGYSHLCKGMGVIALCVGIALLIGGLSGAKDLLQPLSGLGIMHSSETTSTRFERIKTEAQLQQHLQNAGGKYVMLDFYADWCVSCKEMEKFTFSDSAIAAKLGNMLLLQADVTKYDADDKLLLHKFGLVGPPGIIFFNPKGDEIKGIRVVGYQPPTKFLQSLNALQQRP